MIGNTTYKEINYSNASTSATYGTFDNYTNTSGSVTHSFAEEMWETYGKIQKILMKEQTCGWDQWYNTTNTTSADTRYICWDDWSTCCDHKPARLKTPSERIRDIIQSRQAPMILGTRKFMHPAVDPTELRARETLKRVLGEEKFRAFIKNGFVSVQAKSGLVYQIFPGHGMTAVYRDGKMIEKLCVVLRGKFPPTDSIIMRYLLILNDERDFRSHANVFQAIVRRTPEVREQKPLTDIFRRMKVA